MSFSLPHRRPSLQAIFLLTTLVLPTLVLTTSLVSAQEIDPNFTKMVPFGQLAAKLDGSNLEGAEMFLAEKVGVYLLIASGLDQALLINIQQQNVQKVAKQRFKKGEDGSASLLAGAAPEIVGPFQVKGTELSATLTDGQKLTLAPKPNLLGPQTAKSLIAHDKSYGFRARKYPPSEDTLAKLRQEKREVTVKVFFGSWCATCSRMVPWLLQVDQALEGSKIRFEYYGLPGTMDDPENKKMSVTGVPTAIVLVGGKEVGRRSSAGLGIPEKAILEILAGG